MFVLVAFCAAALQILAVTQAEPQYFIVAPNVIRVDVDETILVSVQGTADNVRIPVTLYFHLSGSNQRIAETTVTVSDGEPEEVKLQISRDDLTLLQARDHKFITLVANAFTDELQFEKRRTILLSYRSGFVFIQTDKPLYTPSQGVNIRVVGLDQDMRPSLHKLRVDIINPDNIIIRRYDKAPKKGFLTLQFDFPKRPVFGNWSVVAYYGHQLKVNTSVQFEVKEYVLPTFAVEVIAQEKYIVPDSVNLVTYVKATYVFGKPVVGTFVVKFGVFTDEGNLTILQIKSGQLDDEGGKHVALVMADVNMADWAETLMGKRLLIQAFVTDSSTGETINANNTAVTFSRMPYQFNWDQTQKFFKKGLPFAVKATLQFKSGLPAPNIRVAVSAQADLSDGDVVTLQGSLVNGIMEPVRKLSGSQGELYFRLDIPSDASLVTINLKTEDEKLSETTQSKDTFQVLPQESNEDEYLLIRLPPSSLGRQAQLIYRQSSIDVQLTHPERVHTLYYFVIAGGRIVQRGKKNVVNRTPGLGFLITPEMAPSSRIVAYYTSTASGKIVADALFMEVEERCENPIHLGFVNLPINKSVYETDGRNKNIELMISSNERTTIGLLAVDDAVFNLRKYHRLTKKKMFQRLAGYDLGCGPGGGQTVAAIFKDAGVTVMTNADLEVPQREVLGCPRHVRRARRSISPADRAELLEQYKGHLWDYCEKGLRKLKEPGSLTCAVRARKLARRKFLEKDSAELLAFTSCCELMEEKEEEPDRGRSDALGDFDTEVNLEDVTVRSYFPETWMFDQVETKDDGFVRHPVSLPDTVTTWVVEAVGVSEEYDMCVADPVKLQVRPPFFVDVTMPLSVRRMEQIEILVSVFNYNENTLQVTVKLKGVEGLCSQAQPGNYSKGINIESLPGKSTTAKFIVVPLVAGPLPIEVAAYSSVYNSDAIRKILTVLPEGYKQRDVVSVLMDPQNVRDSPKTTRAGGQNQSFQHDQFWDDNEGNRQVDVIRYARSNKAIPGTHEFHISVMGNTMGNVIKTVISDLDNLLRIPRGCGEQTMLYLAPNVYIYKYLKHTKQTTADLEISSTQFIQDGITNELTHRRPEDGSFSIWGENPAYPSSTWLTAFVSKVMCQAKEFAFVDDTVICEAMRWLIKQQQSVGAFEEAYRVHHQEMTGGIQGAASLTSYVLISLLECNCKTVDKSDSIDSAVEFLEQELPDLTRPFAIAITAYALAKAGSDRSHAAINKLKGIDTFNAESNYRYWRSDDSSFGDGEKPYWYSNQPKAIEVETTSYALLALLEMDDIQHTHAIVNWLTNQENYEGGFVSTQDTVIALQALSQYAIQSQQSGIAMNCHITCDEASFDHTVLLTSNNSITRQDVILRVPETVPEFHVYFASRGQGLGQVKFESSFYIPEPDSSKCAFNLDLNGMEGRSGDADDMEGEIDPTEGDSRSRVGRIERSAFNRGRSSGDGEVDTSFIDGVARNGRAGGTGEEYIFEYNIRVNYLRGDATRMAIVDVGLYTGYHPLADDLENLKANSQGIIQRYEVTQRSVVFYLERITKSEYVYIRFGARRRSLVGKAQPVAVRVYDYYNPTVECVKFIHPQSETAPVLLSTLCEGDTCVCAAGNCADDPKAKLSDFDLRDLKRKVCASVEHFAYVVEVIAIRQKGSFQNISMTIVDPIKKGLDSVSKGHIRTFWKSKSCGLPRIKKKKYLVIGSGGLPYKESPESVSYKYVIDEKMFFYQWPTTSMVDRSGKWSTINERLQKLKSDFSEGGEGCYY